jgi:predicted nucleic acid-binding protein
VRAVADTNAYISALNFGGTPEEILELGRARNVREASTAIQEFAQLIHPREAIHLITEDKPDNRILECAVEANADCVIRRRHQLAFTSTKATNPLHPPFERGKEGVCAFFGS